MADAMTHASGRVIEKGSFRPTDDSWLLPDSDAEAVLFTDGTAVACLSQCEAGGWSEQTPDMDVKPPLFWVGQSAPNQFGAV